MRGRGFGLSPASEVFAALVDASRWGEVYGNWDRGWHRRYGSSEESLLLAMIVYCCRELEEWGGVSLC